MARPRSKPDDSAREVDNNSVRLSISLPAEQYSYLERIAKKQRVSLAWVVRDAILRYMESEAPLFARQD